jgi:undecaprenyl phosphate N,N'-diacetylbacillosamine 1-phosphate transferase
MKRWQGMIKRTLDIMLAGPALIAVAPLLGILACLIRMDSPGPAIFRGARVGRHGTIFQCYKLRTMRVNAPDVRNEDGSTFSAADDARVTRLGRLLRRTGLDELPQLWNVVNGDMSLVGPRPDLPDQVAYYAPADRRRLDVRPGLTGFAAVHGRNEVAWSTRRRLDVEYVERYSLRLDLMILLRTVPLVLTGRGVFGAPVRDGADEPG